jgi:hypothetical protein
MEKKDVVVKKYVERFSADERKQLEAIIGKGKNATWRQLKTRVLLKADVSEAGEEWSNSRIIEALETSASKVYRVRKQLVEEGLEAVLNRKKRVTSLTLRTFDGEKETRLDCRFLLRTSGRTYTVVSAVTREEDCRVEDR